MRGKSLLYRLGNQVPDVASSEILRLGNVRNHLSVAAIQAKGHVDTLPTPASNFEAVAATAQVAPRSDNFSIVGAGWFAGVPLQEQLMSSHQPVNFLVIRRPLSLGAQLASEQRRYPAIAVTPSLAGHGADTGQEQFIRRAIRAPISKRRSAVQVRPSDLKSLGHRAHRMSSSLDKAAGESSFFSRASSIASRRISILLRLLAEHALQLSNLRLELLYFGLRNHAFVGIQSGQRRLFPELCAIETKARS